MLDSFKPTVFCDKQTNIQRLWLLESPDLIDRETEKKKRKTRKEILVLNKILREESIKFNFLKIV